MRLTFHGAAGTVTGSRHLLEAGGQRILVDCGLFQGLKKLRRLNWETPEFEPRFLDHLVLTHAHIDHSGYLPRIMKYDFNSPVHCSEPTAELLELMLMDSAHIQEEDAAYANKRGFSRHKPAEPLYTSYDAMQLLKRVKAQPFDTWIQLGEKIRLKLHNSGHILGAAFAEFRIQGEAGSANSGEETIIFSGDLGRYGVPLHIDPEPMPACDVLVVESTYGDRQHNQESVLDQIKEDFATTIRDKGVVLIPSFAVGRTQMVALILRDMMREGELTEVPIHIDSPMAINATQIYSRHLYDHNLDEEITFDGRSRLFPHKVRLHRTVHESKELNNMTGPRVIIASSGMMTGGRILHHLARRLGDPRNLVLVTGYQAVGTRGRSLQDGAEYLRMHGHDVPVKARTGTIQGLSSHADGDEIMRWIKTAKQPPRKVFVVHGEPDSAAHLAKRIKAEIGSEVAVPALKESFDLADA